MTAIMYIDQKGYYRFCDSHKLVHRWAAEKKLGRKLKDGEVVHHINRDKLDNRPDNLYVCRSQDHRWMLHVIDARKFGWSTSLYGFDNRGMKRKKHSPVEMDDLVSLLKFLVRNTTGINSLR